MVLEGFPWKNWGVRCWAADELNYCPQLQSISIRIIAPTKLCIPNTYIVQRTVPASASPLHPPSGIRRGPCYEGDIVMLRGLTHLSATCAPAPGQEEDHAGMRVCSARSRDCARICDIVILITPWYPSWPRPPRLVTAWSTCHIIQQWPPAILGHGKVFTI